MKVNKRMETESREIPIYTDLRKDLCYFVNVRVSPIDQVDRVVEAALSKLDIMDEPENYLIAKVRLDWVVFKMLFSGLQSPLPLCKFPGGPKSYAVYTRVYEVVRNF